MQIIVFADEKNKEDFLSKEINANIQIKFAEDFSELNDYKAAEAFFILKEDKRLYELKNVSQKPIFINSVIDTLKDLKASGNFIRINAWPGFLRKELWEASCKNEDAAKKIFEQLEWKYKLVKDEPGFVSARVIAMIINEAYFALGENVSSKSEIDVAMMLGTNYPYGPFEWGEKIGIKNIYSLLKKLSKQDERYNIAPVLEKEFWALNN